MSEPTEEGKQLPTITLTWDADKQNVGMKFLTEDFKNWDFVEAVCKMAADFAHIQGGMARAMHMQQAAAQAQQAQRIHQQLARGTGPIR